MIYLLGTYITYRSNQLQNYDRSLDKRLKSNCLIVTKNSYPHYHMNNDNITVSSPSSALTLHRELGGQVVYRSQCPSPPKLNS